MPGVKELRSLRLRVEATPGAQATPRYLWRGPVSGIDDQREITFAEENVGLFGMTDRSYTPKLYAELEIPETEATFQQLPDLFIMAGCGTSGGGNRAGSAQGASGSSVIFTLPVPAAVTPITYSYTAEVGDLDGANNNAEVMTYGLCSELNLTWEGGAALKVDATLFGRYGTATNAMGSYSAAGTIVTPVEEILSGNGTFYLSPITGAFGNNKVAAGNILAGKLSLKPAWTPKFPVDAGYTYFHTAVYTGCEITGELTVENQISGTFGASGSAGLMEKWRQEQPFLMRIDVPGAAISEGTTITTSLLRIDLPIKIEKVDALDDMDGNDIRVFSFQSHYNESSAASGRGTITIVRQGTSEFAGA